MNSRSLSQNRGKTSSRPNAFLATILLSLAIFLLATPATVSAQAPAARRRVAFTQYNSVLYIQGGFTPQQAIGQFSSLDLNTAWKTSTPAWSDLAVGPVASHHAMVVVKPENGAGLGGATQGYLLTIGGNPATPGSFWAAYDFQAGSWKNIPTPLPGNYTGLEGHAVVGDPDTGLVYIVGGFYGNTTQNLLTVFDPKTATVVSSQEATNNSNRTDVAAVWSSKRKTVLTFGGSRAITTVSGFDMANLNEYDPSSKIWKTMATTGDIPTRRLDSCAAASEDGSKIVLFGGSLDSVTFFATVYVLDVVSGVWRQGTSASAYRTRMACGFMAGQFVAFGGSSGSNRETTMHDNVPIIYDLDLDIWSTGYDPAGPTGNGGNGGNGGGDGGKSNTAVVAGAAGGVVAVILVGVVAFFIFRRRRQNRDKEAIESEARIAASVADDDERQGLEYRFDPIAHHKTYMHVSTVDKDKDHYGRSASGPTYSDAGASNSASSRAGQMSAMDHYAAAAALQAQPANSGGAPRIQSTYSDAYTHGTSENDYSALMPLNNNHLRQPPLPSSGASPIDPELYHQQQLHQQQLQFQQQQYQLQQQDLQQQLQHQQQLYHSLGVASVAGAPAHQPATTLTPLAPYAAYSTAGGSGYPSGAYDYGAAAAAAAAANASPLSVQPYQQHQQQLGLPYQTHYQQRDSVAHGPQSWTGSVYDTPSQTQSTPLHPPLTPTAAMQPSPQLGYHGSDSGSQHNWGTPAGISAIVESIGTPSVASTRGPQGIVPPTPVMPTTSRPGGDLGYVLPPK
ncbi:hypothetical protein EC957_004120 [Mortierella hygrophila]|uniref:Galactose oxidase n=1 Tax=Mortierella hygrophila TaxID=979708 RepID=A0A9P6K8U1_9FUNG|nr:hypothetical protein EC957_004120 [Mortierella hygrophila]